MTRTTPVHRITEEKSNASPFAFPDIGGDVTLNVKLDSNITYILKMFLIIISVYFAMIILLKMVKLMRH